VYLSDVDLRQAVLCGDLIVEPLPDQEIGATSIDLHLDSIEQAQVWNLEALAKHNKDLGHPPNELHVARMNYATVSRQFMIPPPHESDITENDLVFRRDNAIILRPHGFVVWQTRERAGTPEENPRYICFIDGKSTRSRTGLIVHLTAPTVHAGWNGNLTLEMANVGPLDLVLFAGDAVAQLTVARLSWPPSLDVKLYESATHGQTSVHGVGSDTSS
jgi:deoxycytidine triphosphate deaminase